MKQLLQRKMLTWETYKNYLWIFFKKWQGSLHIYLKNKYCLCYVFIWSNFSLNEDQINIADVVIVIVRTLFSRRPDLGRER